MPRAFSSGITDVKADGKDVVVVTLKDANADMPFLFTDYHFNVVPSLGEGKADITSTHGTGLYLLKEFQPGIKTTLERNPNAWQSDQFGHFDSAEILAILDDNARQTALITGVGGCDQPPGTEDHQSSDKGTARPGPGC